MEQKIIVKYEYLGLGFLVILKNVVCLKIQECWYPKIDVEKVAKESFNSLIEKSFSSLTGNELEFIRTYLNLTKSEFAKKLNVTCTTISRWEKTGSKVPKTKKITYLPFQTV
ncbi:MAG: hypothetical protein QM487_12795 [Candidatus Marithrix sp.]